MSHTRKQRKLIAGAFRVAKTHLWDGGTRRTFRAESEFICHALLHYSKHPGAELAEREVMQRLGGEFTVVGWLIKQGHLPQENLMTKRHRQLVQEYRHRWLDALAAEFEAPATT